MAKSPPFKACYLCIKKKKKGRFILKNIPPGSFSSALLFYRGMGDGSPCSFRCGKVQAAPDEGLEELVVVVGPFAIKMWVNTRVWCPGTASG